jgi:MFS transporter, FHS family, glucose/mannose:H+ symporter
MSQMQTTKLGTARDPDDTTKGLHRGVLLLLAGGDMYLFGTSVAFLGAILLPLMRTFHLDAGAAGDLFFAMHLGSLVACIAAGLALDRLGTRPILCVSLVLLGAGLWGLTVAKSVIIIAASVFIIGFAGGGLNTGAITLVSDAFRENRKSALNVLSIFFGCGAIVLSFAIGLVTRSWPLFLRCSAVIAWVWAAAGFFTRFPLVHEAHGFSAAAALRTLRNPVALLFAGLIFCQMGNEITVGGWTAPFLSTRLGASARAATLSLSLYWIAIVLGRLVAAILLRSHIEAAHLVVASGVGAAFCTVVLLTTSRLVVGDLAVFCLGLCYAAMLPTTLAMAGDRFPRFAGTLFGTLFAAGVIGSMIFPSATGHLAKMFNLRVGLTLPLAGAIAIVILELLLLRKSTALT